MPDITYDRLREVLEGFELIVTLADPFPRQPSTVRATVGRPGDVAAQLLAHIEATAAHPMPEPDGGTVRGFACKHCLFDIYPDPRGWRIGIDRPWYCEGDAYGQVHEPATEEEMRAMVREPEPAPEHPVVTHAYEYGDPSCAPWRRCPPRPPG